MIRVDFRMTNSCPMLSFADTWVISSGATSQADCVSTAPTVYHLVSYNALNHNDERDDVPNEAYTFNFGASSNVTAAIGWSSSNTYNSTVITARLGSNVRGNVC